MENYLLLNTPVELFKVLFFSKLSKDKILIWQNSESGKKIRCDAQVESLDPDNGCFLVRCGEGAEVKFSCVLPIYLRFKNRSLMFQARVSKFEKKIMKIEVPEDFRIMENRASTRKQYLNDEVKIQIEKLDIDALVKPSFSLSAIDISNIGMAIKYSVSKINTFKVGDRYFVKKIGVRKLSNWVECEIVHLTEMNKLKKSILTNRDFKMGLSFVHGENEIIREFLD